MPQARESRQRSKKHLSALDELDQLRKSGGVTKRLRIQEKDDDKIYDEVEETEYEQMVSKRQAEGFIVDDDGLGYEENAEEDEWRYEDDDEDPEPTSQKNSSKKGDEDQSKKKKNGGTVVPDPKKVISKRLDTMLLASSRKDGPGLGAKRKADEVDTDAVLEDLLGDLLDRKDAAGAEHPPRSKRISANPVAPAVLKRVEVSKLAALTVKRASGKSAAQEDPYAKPPPPPVTASDFDDMPEPIDDLPSSAPSPPTKPSTPIPTSTTSTGPNARPQSPQPPSTTTGAQSKFKSRVPQVVAVTTSSSPTSPTSKLSDGATVIKTQPQAVEAKPIVTSPTSPTAKLITKVEQTKAAAAAVPPGAEEIVAPSLAPHPALGGALAVQDSTEKGASAAGAWVSTAGAALPLEEDGSFKMYWFDAWEEPGRLGQIFLFGKVLPPEATQYVSCCVLIKDVPRNVYFLPRQTFRDDPMQEVELGDVFSELGDIMMARGVTKFASNVVERSYAFEVADVPRTPVKYLKVVYSASLPALPSDLQGRTFSHVFGTTATSLETFILKRKLMGPSWVRIRSAQRSSAPITFCKVEATVESYKDVEVLPDQTTEPPPLSMLSLAFKTITNPKTNSQEVALVSGLFLPEVKHDGRPTPEGEKRSVKFSAVRKVDGTFPFDLRSTIEANRISVQLHDNERSLLSYLVSRFSQLDPDLVIGHNLITIDLAVVLNRMSHYRLPQWARIGRLKRQTLPKLNSGGRDNYYAIRSVLSGRLLCDTYDAAKELVREKNYDLTHIAASLLHEERVNVCAESIPQLMSTTNDLLSLVNHTDNDAVLALRLSTDLMVVPLTKQLTALAGNLWARSLRGSSRAERNEFLLLHEFHRLKYILPDKAPYKGNAKSRKSEGADAAADHKSDDEEEEGGKKATGKRKPAYAGGLVLEPKRGLYDKFVILLDFNSLYPSIIQEFNIDFTTVVRPTQAAQDAAKDEDHVMAELPAADLAVGVLPRVIRALVERRRQVKGLIKSETDPVKLQQLDIRQKALKLTANSMYGCLGFQHSRFYCKPMAELITSQGREILQRTVNIAQTALNLEVIYGDTDSVMIHTGLTDLAAAKNVAVGLKKEVNKQYKNLEIELDAVFKSMLLLRKKKYAALKLVGEKDGVPQFTKEVKGLDMVRRDWCKLSQEVSGAVLDEILSDKSRDDIVEAIHSYLRSVGEKVNKNLINLRDFIITKSLSKAPSDYPDAKGLPHVQVALQLAREGRQLRPGEFIEYVICVDPSKPSFAERAYSPEKVIRAAGGLAIDFQWYLSTQIHPPVARMCEPIEGTNPGLIAECLGLDSSRFRGSVSTSSGQPNLEQQMLGQGDDDEKFRSVMPLMVRCPNPRCLDPFGSPTSQPFTGFYKLPPSSSSSSSTARPDPEACFKCNSCSAAIGRGLIENALIQLVRTCIEQYYEGALVCDECGLRTCKLPNRFTPMSLPKCLVGMCPGTMQEQYTAQMLYRQLQYLQRLFDQSASTSGSKENSGELSLSSTASGAYSKLKQRMEKILSLCAYRFISLTDLRRLLIPSSVMAH